MAIKASLLPGARALMVFGDELDNTITESRERPGAFLTTAVPFPLRGKRPLIYPPQEDRIMCPGHAKGTDMATVQQQLVAKTKEAHRAHVIVMTAVVAVALISATAALVAGSTSSTLLSAPRHEAITVDARASEAPVMPQSLASRACAGTPLSKHELERRVAEAARTLAGRPRLKGMSQAQREKHVQFVVGNLLFVLGHEIGHAVIREMGVPVVGREEDAADFFSTLMALMCEEGFGDRVLANAALGWFLSDRRDRRDQRVGATTTPRRTITASMAWICSARIPSSV